MILLVGGSTMREAFISPKQMEDMLGERGVSLQVLNLSSFDQTLEETDAILAEAIDSELLRRGDIVVIGVHPNRLSKPAGLGMPLERLPFLQPASSTKVGPAAALVDPFFAIWRSKSFLWTWIEGHLTPNVRMTGAAMRRLECFTSCLMTLAGGDLWRWPRGYLRYAYPDSELPEDVRLSMTAEVVRLRVPAFRANHEEAVARLAPIFDLLDRHGIRAVLVNLPRSALSYKAFSPIELIYLENMRSYESRGVEFLNLASEPVLANTQFYDLDHIRRGSRLAVTASFVSRLAAAGKL